MSRVLSSSIVFNDKLIIEESIIEYERKQFKNLRVKREEASAVLILNTDSNKIILTSQFRYAISDKVTEHLLEIVAGKVDEGEEPLNAAIRETEEEVGYKIKEGHIQLLLSCFVTPGYSTEKFYIYYATVTHTDQVSKGGGLNSENENIKIIEMDADEFVDMVKQGRFCDAKTYIAGLYFANYI